MKSKNSNWIFKVAYQLSRLFFILYLLFFLLNLFFNYSVPFDGSSKFTVRGHVSLTEKDWKPMEVTTLNENCNSTFLLYKTGFVRFDFDNWEDALTINSILYILLYNVWLLMGLFIIFQLFQVFKSIVKDRVFKKENTKRLRLVALTIIVMPIIQNLSQRFFFLFARTNFEVNGNNIGLPQNHDFFGFPYLPYLAVGFLIFAIVEIYNEGMRLQSETDLTI